MDVVLCGVSGYGDQYASILFENDKDINWVGAVDPFPERIPDKYKTNTSGLHVFDSLENFYKSKTADLCIVSSPIAFHSSQSILALENGSHVYCEKPIAALPGEVAAMIEARDKSGKFLAVGYQMCHSDALLKLKHDINETRIYGKPVRLKTRVLWPRDRDYYNRGSKWAGREKDSSGRWVLDSVANNATAHYLQNMLYILGEKNRTIYPDTVTAVLMRANPIQMYDTAFIRIEAGNTEILFIASHCLEHEGGVQGIYEFENGKIMYNNETGLTGILDNGETIEYGNPHEPSQKIFWKLVSSLRGENEVGFSCPPEAASVHNRIMIAALLSAEIGTFETTDVKDNFVYVPGLDKICLDCYENAAMPDEKWVNPGKKINLSDIRIDTYGS